MFQIPQSTVLALAAETRSAVDATDQALRAGNQLLASLLEGAATSNLPLAATQRLFAKAHAHSGKLIEGRQGLCDLVSSMTAVKNNSDQRELAIGCPRGLPDNEKPATPSIFTEGTLQISYPAPKRD